MAQIKILNSQITSSGDILIKAGLTASSSSIFLSSGGLVGIGKQTPTSKLDVSGSTVITGSLTTTSDISLANTLTLSSSGDVTVLNSMPLVFRGDIVLSGSLTIENLGTLSNRDDNSVLDLGGFF